MKKYTFLFALVALLLSSCGTQNDNNEKVEELQTPQIEQLDSLSNEMDEISNEIDKNSKELEETLKELGQ